MTHGGRRNGAGRKPLDGGTVQVSFRLEAKYIEIIRQWRNHHDCKSDSEALRQILSLVAPLHAPR